VIINIEFDCSRDSCDLNNSYDIEHISLDEEIVSNTDKIIEFDKNEIMDDIMKDNPDFKSVSVNSNKRPISLTSFKKRTAKVKRRPKGKLIATVYTDVPLSYNEALNRSDAESWKEAINEELNNFYSNKIMTYV